MDARLHEERLQGRAQRSWHADWTSLPDGTFALIDDAPVLVLGDTIVPWAAGKYGTPSARPNGRATVLTPPATVSVLSAKYVPVIAEIPSKS